MAKKPQQKSARIFTTGNGVDPGGSDNQLPGTDTKALEVQPHSMIPPPPEDKVREKRWSSQKQLVKNGGTKALPKIRLKKERKMTIPTRAPSSSPGMDNQIGREVEVATSTLMVARQLFQSGDVQAAFSTFIDGMARLDSAVPLGETASAADNSLLRRHLVAALHAQINANTGLIEEASAADLDASLDLALAVAIGDEDHEEVAAEVGNPMDDLRAAIAASKAA